MKVQFYYLSTVEAIETQGRYQDYILHWMTSFRVEYSVDCNSFNAISTLDGQHMVSNRSCKCFVVYLF